MIASRSLVQAILFSASQCFPVDIPGEALTLDGKINLPYKRTNLPHDKATLVKRLDPLPPPGSIYRLDDPNSPYYLEIGNYQGGAEDNSIHDLETQAGTFFQILDSNPGSYRSADVDAPTDAHGVAEVELTMAPPTDSSLAGIFADFNPADWQGVADGLYDVLERFGTWALTQIRIYTGDPNNFQEGDFIATFTVRVNQGA